MFHPAASKALQTDAARLRRSAMAFDVDQTDIIEIAREMEAMAQAGLHFSEDRFDRQRYTRLRELAAGR